MKIALAQLNPKVGDLQNNGRKILQFIQECQSPPLAPLTGGISTDLIIFPELAMCGYPPRDLLLQKQFVLECWNYLHEIIIPKTETPTLIGLPTIAENHRQLYNSVAYIKNKKLVQIIHKKLLPNYEVFNESRYFKAATMADFNDLVIDVNGKKVAVFICEDMLAVEDKFALYAQNPVDFLAGRIHLDLVVCCSASPFRKGHLDKRINFARAAQAKLTSHNASTPVVLVNQVGANDDLIFDGSSFVVGAAGQVLHLADRFKESLMICETNLPPSPLVRGNLASQGVLEMREALVLGIRDYFQKTGFQKAFIGLSGGVDSALVACLAVEALGKNNVTGVMMPSEYSSQGSIVDAERLARNLGIENKKIEIQPILQAFLEQSGLQSLTLAEENLQSRIRGSLLMGLANQEKGLVLATGNKSEFSVGYSTLYGDMCGALAPIGDLWKTQVWEMSKTFSTMPREIIDKPPSAELRPDQLDTDSLPDYKLLDDLLKAHIENGLCREQLLEHGFPEAIVNKVLKLLAVSEFKRRQAPIILKVSIHAFGSGWQYPVACER